MRDSRRIINEKIFCERASKLLGVLGMRYRNPQEMPSIYYRFGKRLLGRGRLFRGETGLSKNNRRNVQGLLGMSVVQEAESRF